MKYCTNCGKEINEDTKFCPHCGNSVSNNNASNSVSKRKTKLCKHCHNEMDAGLTICPTCRRGQGRAGCLSIFLGIIIFIILIGVVVSMSTSFDSEGNELKDNIEKNIGEELTCSDYKVVINEYKIKTGAIDSYQEVPEGTEWIGLIVTATNTSDDEVNINSSNFELTNSNGEVISYDVISYPVYGNYGTLGGTLAPGGTKTGYVSFSNTNTDNSNLTIKFKCGFWKSGSYIIHLR